MANIVLRVRLIGGDHMDVSYEDPATDNEDDVIDYVVSCLSQDSGVLRSRHGDRLQVLFARGVASFEVSPRGAIL